jgi:hypothetical protein
VFVSVLERLHKNWALEDDLFQQHDAWKALWAYGTGKAEGSYGWLNSRRNALTHAVLIPRDTIADGEYEMFPGDNLWNRLVLKVAPAGPETELLRIETHVSAMSDLHGSVMDLCFFGLRTYGLRPWRLRPAR